MSKIYKYGIWDGKNIISYYTSWVEIRGTFLGIPTFTSPKQSYSLKIDEYPLMWIPTSTTYNSKSYEFVIDIRRKSKRQRDRLLKE